jgi:hypothetical protein
MGTDMLQRCVSPFLYCRFWSIFLTVVSAWLGCKLPSTLADFTGGQPIPNTPYTFAPFIFTGGLYNNGGRFEPDDPFFNFFPITAAPVPGAPNLLAVARQWAGVDLVDVHTGNTTKLLQLPVAPFPSFDPIYNQVTLPGTTTPRTGELYVFNESGVLGLAFHPNYAAPAGTPGHGKFYVNVTVDNRDLFIPGIDPTDGIQPSEVDRMNDPNDPAHQGLLACFICDHPDQFDPVASQANGNFAVACPDATANDPKVSAANPNFMEVREYTVNNGAVVTDGSGIPTYNTILRFQRQRDYHVAGSLAFGPGGLYISSGDSKGSPSQAITHPEDPDADFFGKILRIDVDGPDAYPADPTRNYAIPANNPFKSGPLATMTTADDEVYAYGLRNPWRISLDANGDLWIGDVGYNSAEEVNLVPAGTGGQNFGWPYYEGIAETPEHVADGRPLGQPPANAVPPEHFYATGQNNRGSIIGGYVYRGPDSTLHGDYIYYDLVRRKLFSYDPVTKIETNHSHNVFDDDNNNNIPDDDNGDLRPEINNVDVGALTSFVQDSVGNLFVVSYSDGEIYRLRTADVNYDGAINAVDIDLLAAEAQKPPGSRSILFDLNNDGVVNFVAGGATPSDSDYLVETVLKTKYGDANLDGKVSLFDLAVLGSAFDNPNTGWSMGNFNGVGGTTLFDLTLLSQNYGFERPPMGLGAALVPEPSTAAMMLVALAMFWPLLRCNSKRHVPAA